MPSTPSDFGKPQNSTSVGKMSTNSTSRVETAPVFLPGATKFKDGKMAKWVKKNSTAEKKDQLVKVIAAVSAEAKLKSQTDRDAKDTALIKEGKELLKSEFSCTDCHRFHNTDEDATAPVLTGYGSRDWLVKFLSNSGHEDFYGKRNDRMPAFAEKGILDANTIGILADWLRGEWYEPARK